MRNPFNSMRCAKMEVVSALAILYRVFVFFRFTKYFHLVQCSLHFVYYICSICGYLYGYILFVFNQISSNTGRFNFINSNLLKVRAVLSSQKHFEPAKAGVTPSAGRRVEYTHTFSTLTSPEYRILENSVCLWPAFFAISIFGIKKDSSSNPRRAMLLD